MIDDIKKELKEDLENLRITYIQKLNNEAKNIANLSAEERSIEGRKLNEVIKILQSF